MKFCVIYILVLIMLNGCGTISKEYKVVKETMLQKKNYIGHNIYFIDSQKHLLWVANNDHNHSSELYTLKQMLINVNFVKKTIAGYKLTNITSMKTKDGKYWLYNFGYDNKKNEYSLSGKYTYITDKKNKESIRFVAIYDAISFEIKNIYYKVKGEKEDVDMSSNGKYVIFTGFRECTLLNIDTKKTVNFKIPKNMYSFWNKEPKFSNTGKYVAFLLEEKTKLTNKEIILLDAETGKIKKEFKFYSDKYNSTYNYSYNFSNDEKLFVYKGYRDKFKVFDINSEKIIKSFGTLISTDVKWESSDIIADGKYLMAMYHISYKDRSKGRKSILNLYDINKNKIVCQIENEKFSHSFIDKKNNILHLTTNWEPTKIYSIKQDICKNIGEVNENGYSNVSYGRLRTIQKDTIYLLHNGDVKKFSYRKKDMIELENLITQ